MFTLASPSLRLTISVIFLSSFSFALAVMHSVQLMLAIPSMSVELSDEASVLTCTKSTATRLYVQSNLVPLKRMSGYSLNHFLALPDW